MDQKTYLALGQLTALCAIHNPSLSADRVVSSPKRWLTPTVQELSRGPQRDKVEGLLEDIGGSIPASSIWATNQRYFFYAGYHSLH